MKIGILAVTKGGFLLAEELKSKFPEAEIHVRTGIGVSSRKIEGNFAEYIGGIFNEYDSLIFIMACGIVVRSIAPYLKNKTIDPGVIVMDEKGKYVISLLSGHIGGANAFAIEVSKRIGAEPVITTSSDVNGLISVDILAQRFGCAIDDMEAAKHVTFNIVNGGKTAVVSGIPCVVPDSLSCPSDEAEGIICISNKININDDKPCVQLIPDNVIIGIGCKRGVDGEAIINFIKRILNDAEINERSVKCLASISIKKDEKGITDAAMYFNKSVKFFTAEEIALVEDKFAVSGFVKEKTGVGAVAEPCAYLASDRTGKLLLNRQKGEGITIALWEEERNFAL